MEVDAIVNPTDCHLSGSGSIDLKIHRAGKAELKNELAAFGKCNVGDAILTHAYKRLWLLNRKGRTLNNLCK
jgi:O-acetyl-ADP-ribose deacetylase (regulator of RNase III)